MSHQFLPFMMVQPSAPSLFITLLHKVSLVSLLFFSHFLRANNVLFILLHYFVNNRVIGKGVMVLK